MIHRFLRKILAAGCCMLLLAGCGTGAAENTPQAITSESEGDRLIDSADLIGSVISVEADGFALQPTETDGDTQADGSILAMRVVIVQYAQATGEGGGEE